jgi:hypothetical protein
MTPRSLISPLAVALATCALVPVAASAAPVIEGQGIAAGGGPGVTAEQFAPRSLAAPDQVDRVRDQTANVYVPPTSTDVQPTSNLAPQWPNGPQPVATRHAPAHHATPAASPSDDGGLDTGIWIAIGGGALVAAGGLGLAGRKRLVLRKGQLA